MMKNKELSIIIVNYKNYLLTIECIESILKTTSSIDYEVIVIDNNSPNNSYNNIKDKFENIEQVRIIKNEKNSGFGAANNLGVSECNGKYVLILNPDVMVKEKAIELLLNKLKSNSNIGLVASQLLNGDLSIQYSCRRVLPFFKFLSVRTPLAKFISKSKREEINNLYLMKDFDHTSECEVPWVMGACMLLEKDYFIEIGRFSKEYFMYFEDVDLCCKVWKSGKSVVYLPESQMIHLHNQESTKKINKMTFIHLQSMFKFYLKHLMNKI